jgi:hypothetical protein
LIDNTPIPFLGARIGENQRDSVSSLPDTVTKNGWRIVILSLSKSESVLFASEVGSWIYIYKQKRAAMKVQAEKFQTRPMTKCCLSENCNAPFSRGISTFLNLNETKIMLDSDCFRHFRVIFLCDGISALGQRVQ